MKRLVINTLEKKAKIHREIYGHFAEHLGRCIYEGLFVGEDNTMIPHTNGMRNDVVAALRDLRVPVLRWPGGCFADEYHWKDGIGPKQQRKKMINTHWGGVLEDNSFGTHEFLELCRQIGCRPYINGNVGSGTVQEMSEWVEYLTFDGTSPMTQLRASNGQEQPWDVPFFGVGNESWGCGGNLRPQAYADLYRRYATYCRNYGDKTLYKIACGPNANDYAWTQELLKALPAPDSGLVNGISLHYYTTPGSFAQKKPALGFDRAAYHETIAKAWYMDTLIQRHSDIMNQYDPDRRLGLIVDEWGCWYEVEPGTNPGFLYQQNTMRDAIVAAVTLNIFNQHADRVRMANLAQMVNVPQSVLLTEGPRMVKTPTYHVFLQYKEHMDGQLLGSYLENSTIGEGEYLYPQLSHSASLDAEGRIHLSLVNASPDCTETIQLLPVAFSPAGVSATVVTGAIDAHNTFETPDRVRVESFDDVQRAGDGTLTITLPPCSVVFLTLSE
ncbi:MAG: alpha-L-arabinofuranosidase C-terminal domain-containing protein [Eubacteriales bacterium]|nr:alpha-L-arabinofuranosidase C-terminal domain-containing protein [Eubacteriales bacterium]